MQKLKRKKYFIHPSSQLKYILLCLLPASFISIFCIQFMFISEESMMAKENVRIIERTRAMNNEVSLALQTLREKRNDPILVKSMSALVKELIELHNSFTASYYNVKRQWADTKAFLFSIVVASLILTAFISLFFSHSVAGPLLRLRKLVDSLAEGKDVSPMFFRKYDEFKELGESFEKLRQALKQKGVLK